MCSSNELDIGQARDIAAREAGLSPTTFQIPTTKMRDYHTVVILHENVKLL